MPPSSLLLAVATTADHCIIHHLTGLILLLTAAVSVKPLGTVMLRSLDHFPRGPVLLLCESEAAVSSWGLTPLLTELPLEQLLTL